jgi:hypothetical protein
MPRDQSTGQVETTTFAAFVNAPDGRPFVQMTCALDGEPVFAVKMSPAVCTALGLRAIQASFDADAGTMRPLSGDDRSELTDA